MMQKIEHTSFVIERELPENPERAFQFWADRSLKAKWTSCHDDWRTLEDEFEFRANGREVKRWRTPEGDELAVGITYLDIVPGERLLYAYEMSWNEERLSASLVTIELAASPGGTRMTFTEQAAFLAGTSSEQRVQGTEQGFDRLVATIAGETADAA